MTNYGGRYFDNHIMDDCSFDTVDRPMIYAQNPVKSPSNTFTLTLNTTTPVNTTIDLSCKVRYGDYGVFYTGPKLTFNLEILNETICNTFITLSNVANPVVHEVNWNDKFDV